MTPRGMTNRDRAGPETIAPVLRGRGLFGDQSGVGMDDAFEMRFRLQQVAAYRELCRGVRRSGRDNIFFSLFMMVLAYIAWQNQPNNLIIMLFGILIVGELLVGVFKWVAPSAEGLLLDAIVLLVFAGVNLGLQYVRFQAGGPMNPVMIFLGAFMLLNAIGRFQAYKQLRKLFAERPTAEHIAWFNELIREIQSSDPQQDDLALDLPTKPHWKAKLLGTMVFFFTVKGQNVWIAGPEDFELLREKTDRGTGLRRGLLKIHGQPYPEFEMTDATWDNYQQWQISQSPIPSSPKTPGGHE